MNQGSPGKWQVFSLVAVGVFMSTLDGSIVNIALPTIMQEMETSFAVVEWVMIIYLLTISSLILSFGRLSDIKGRRFVYGRGLIIFASGSFFCGISANAAMLIMSRAFQGTGAAMIMSCSPALIIDIFPINERGKALGMVGAVVASGLTTGPALGGWLIHILSWHYIFLINIPIGLVTAWVALRILKGTPADVIRQEKFDFYGSGLLTAGFASLLIGVTHGFDWGYTSVRFIGCLGFAVICLGSLFPVERRVPHPVFDPELLKIRLFILPICSAMILFAALFTMVFLMPFFLINPCGFAVKKAGAVMVTPFIFLFAFSPVSGALSDKIGSRMLCTIGMTILTISLFFLTRLTPDSNLIAIMWRLALAGIGTAIFIAPNSSITMTAVPPERKGIAAGTVAAARNLGMVTGIAASGVIFNSVFYYLSSGEHFQTWRPELEPIFMTAFHHAMTSGVIMAGIGIIVTFLRGSEKRGGLT